MSGPGNGRFLIVSAQDPKPTIGADPDDGAVRPVITEGDDKVWNVGEIEPGKYGITLSGWLTRPDIENNVVVDTLPNRQVWLIRAQGNEGQYTIESDSLIRPNRGWTLSSVEPKSLVALRIIEIPYPAQLWEFIRVLE
ncbi:hypothetical protein BS17DRAFT_779097 [Gyrodon lividus]|nr:hypothetical protein BS17DRAFT_779097 [Gyrodon lividus]